jgi:hypothetical protein
MHPPEIRQTILSRVTGGESLRSICRDDDMPGLSTVMEWLAADEDFRSKYARAREDQADAIFEGMSEIEDSVIAGDLRPDAARVVLESRRWRAEKLKPKKYGNKIEATHELGETFTKVVREIVRG